MKEFCFKKILITFLIILEFLIVGSEYISYDRKYTFDVQTDFVKAEGISTDGISDILEYDLKISPAGLSISSQYFGEFSETVPITDFNLILQSFSFSGAGNSESYENWDWTSFIEIATKGEQSFEEKFFGENGTISEETEEKIVIEISATKTISTETVDGAVKAKFTLNPKTGYVGVLDVAQNDVKFDFQVNFSKLKSYTTNSGNSGTFTLSGIFQTDQNLNPTSEDAETISFPLVQNDEFKTSAANFVVAKKWDCSDSSVFTISKTTISPSDQKGEFQNAYSVSWEIVGNFETDVTCIWDPVISLNENRTYTPSSPINSGGGSANNRGLAIGLGILFSVLGVIAVVLVIYFLMRQKPEEVVDQYEIR